MGYTLEWDKTGEKIYETGDKKMVLYVMGKNGNYQNGVAWNGITAVSSNDSGAEETALWADDIKYAVLRSAPEYGGTIEAYQCPNEFHLCDGSSVPSNGIIVGQQGRRGFGISYVTTIGNDVMGTDYGYEIHIVWGCSASPSERSYQTINDSPDAITLSWEFTTTPVTVIGYPDIKPISHVIIDSTKVNPGSLKALEDYIYGTRGTMPRLPSPSDVIDMFKSVDYSGYDVGDEYLSSYKDILTDTTYENPLIVLDDPMELELENGSVTEVLPVQMKYATLESLQYSGAQALFVFPNGLSVGTYNFTLGDAYLSTSSGTKFQFTLAEDIPENGKLGLYSAYNGDPTSFNNLKAVTYDSTGKNVIEYSADYISTGSGGSSLGTAYANTRNGNINSLDNAIKGTDNWSRSSIRQWLNSDAAAGEWWHANDKFDVAPYNLNDIPGFLAGLPSELRARLRAVKTVSIERNDDNLKRPVSTYDYVVLPSLSQVYTEEPVLYTDSINEGEAFEYWKGVNGTEHPWENSSYASSTVETPTEFKAGSIDKPETACDTWFRTIGPGGNVEYIVSKSNIHEYPIGIYSSHYPVGVGIPGKIHARPVMYIG